MSKVTVCDGCGITIPEINHGAHSLTTTYEYSDGYYDRNKKDFYGFGTVKTTNADGNCQKDVYYNREYYSKGCVSSSTVKTADGALLSESTTTLEDAPYPLPKKEESKIYEKSSGNGNYIYSATSYSYDLLYGNCVKVEQDFGDSEILTGEISYKILIQKKNILPVYQQKSLFMAKTEKQNLFVFVQVTIMKKDSLQNLASIGQIMIQAVQQTDLPMTITEI